MSNPRKNPFNKAASAYAAANTKSTFSEVQAEMEHVAETESIMTESGGDKKIARLPPLVVEVMDEIKRNWAFTMVEQYNAVPHALTLLDNSSLGRDHRAFERLYNKLEGAMDLIVNDYHQGFNSAIQKFSGVVENITDSQSRVSKMREALEASRTTLSNKSFDLFHLWLKSNQYTEMVKIIERIEYFTLTSEKVDNLADEKFYSLACKLIVSNLKELNSSDFSQIGALSDIRIRLEEHKKELPETLIEQLHNHLYFKNEHSINRFKVYENEPHIFSLLIESTNLESLDIKEKEDYDIDPEIDSFSYIKSIIISLDTLGVLNDALRTTRERLSSEVYFLIERVIQDIETRKAEIMQKLVPSMKTGIPDLFANNISEEDELLFNELLSSLFPKLYGVIQCYYYISKVVTLVDSKSENPTMGFDIRDVWMMIQNEVKAFLYDHFSNPTNQIEKHVNALDYFLETNKTNVAKQVFHVTTDLDHIQVEQIYNSLFESAEQRKGSVGIPGIGGMIVDRYANQFSATHKVLLKPDPYFVIIGFMSTQKFVQRVETLLESNMGMLEGFLNDFISNVYIPELQERVVLYIQTFIHGIDAFRTEFSTSSAPFPLVRSSLAVISLVKSLCKCVSLIPVNQQDCIVMIENCLVQYFEKCLKRFYTVLHPESAETDQVDTVSLMWAKNLELMDLLKLRSHHPETMDSQELGSLSQKEILLQSQLKGDRSLHRSELVFDPVKLQSLGHLEYSLEWIASQLEQMLSKSSEFGNETYRDSIEILNEKNQKSSLDSLVPVSELKQSVESFTSLAVSEDEAPALPLFEDAVNRYEAIVSEFRELAQLTLNTLRLEFRCHCMYFLDLAIREGNYFLSEEAEEPDPYIWALNQDLAIADETMLVALPATKIRYVFDGLTHLVSFVLVSNIKYIKRLNFFGVGKLVRNVRSLKMNLTNLIAIQEKDLERVENYYGLLEKGGESLIKFMDAHPGMFTFDEYKSVLDVIYEDGLTDRTSSTYDEDRSKLEYDYCLKKMKEHFIKIK